MPLIETCETCKCMGGHVETCPVYLAEQLSELIPMSLMGRTQLIAEINRLKAIVTSQIDGFDKLLGEYHRLMANAGKPIPMILMCALCNRRHVDEGKFATHPHHTHACQGCGFVWRPAIVATVGVNFLPGFKDGESDNKKDNPEDNNPERGVSHG